MACYSEVPYLKSVVAKALAAQAKQREDLGWTGHCRENLGLPRVNVLAKLSRKERDLVIAYHRVKIERELASAESSHFIPDGRYCGWTRADYRKSAKGRLVHLEKVVQAFSEIDHELGLIAA